jgi:DNA-binding NarL/FixJ family response regulator
MTPIPILIIDDHPMFRSGLGLLLRSGIASLQVDYAGSLDEALHGELPPPALVLLDIQLPGLNGLDGIALLRRKWPQTPIVVLSANAAADTLALARGATAFVSKEQTADDILAVVNEALALAPGEALAPADPANSAPWPPELTPRQCEVLDLLCQGLPNKAIGRRLALSENTVRGHVQGILAVLNVTNRSEAAFAPRRRGLIL